MKTETILKKIEKLELIFEKATRIYPDDIDLCSEIYKDNKTNKLFFRNYEIDNRVIGPRVISREHFKTITKSWALKYMKLYDSTKEQIEKLYDYSYEI